MSAGDKTSPLLIATINGHFDLAQALLDKGADPKLASDNGATPLYGVLNVEWAPKALYPQPRAQRHQKIGYLELMKALLDKGADPNAAAEQEGLVLGLQLRPVGRRRDRRDAVLARRLRQRRRRDEAAGRLRRRPEHPHHRSRRAVRASATCSSARSKDVSGLPPVPVGGPAVTPLQAAAGVGYGEGFAANSHRFAPTGMLAAVKYLVEELGADVNAVDHEGNTALHHAAARGDIEMILYLVSKGANVQGRRPRRPDDRRHGQRPGAAHPAVPGDASRCSRSSARRTTTSASLARF